MPLGLLHATPSGGLRPIQPTTAPVFGAGVIHPPSVELQLNPVARRRPFGRIEGLGLTTSRPGGCQQERLWRFPEGAWRVVRGQLNASSQLSAGITLHFQRMASLPPKQPRQRVALQLWVHIWRQDVLPTIC